MDKVEVAILLAGGDGTRLRPFTFYTSKHLLPVYNKPMIFYPLTNLILLGVNEVLLVINPKHRSQWDSLLQNIDLPIKVVLVEQEVPDGVPKAISLCESYLRSRSFYLALGDNILLASGKLSELKEEGKKETNAAVVIGFPVKNPESFGVAKFDKRRRLCGVVEKPANAPSNIAIIGLYKFDSEAPNLVKKLKKSKRGEFEIADLINQYINEKKCHLIECNTATDFWLDTGNIAAIDSASNLLRELQIGGGGRIGALEDARDFIKVK